MHPLFRIILITALIGFLDQVFPPTPTSLIHTIIVCWVSFGALLFSDFKRTSRGKLLSHWTTDIIVGVFACLMGPLALLLVLTRQP